MRYKIKTISKKTKNKPTCPLCKMVVHDNKVVEFTDPAGHTVCLDCLLRYYRHRALMRPWHILGRKIKALFAKKVEPPKTRKPRQKRTAPKAQAPARVTPAPQPSTAPIEIAVHPDSKMGFLGTDDNYARHLDNVASDGGGDTIH